MFNKRLQISLHKQTTEVIILEPSAGLAQMKRWSTAAGNNKLSLITLQHVGQTLNLIFNSNIKLDGFQHLLPNVDIWQIQSIISFILEWHSWLCE